MLNMGPGGWVLVGTGIALPATLPATIPRVHPSPYPRLPVRRAGPDMQLKVAVGLKSVDQLTLSPVFSDIRGMTEVYNLKRIDIR